ncbi:MAG: glycosyltransferase [Candidatus Eisenbacteria bacterium]|nr:glycosyltransferase [Candidatus Eisenbacteria bacterium]
MRHLFVIPGWYPHRPCYPLEGDYIRQQAEAIGDLLAGVAVTLSLWDQGRGDVSFGHLRKSPRCVLGGLVPRPIETALAPNVIEQRTPVRAWNPRFAGGNRMAILRANRINLERASARWGRPDILHAHVSYPAGWMAMQLSREQSIPYVLTEHMGPFPLSYFKTHDGSLNPLLREPLANANATIAVSPSLADQIESFGLDRPRFIPNLVDERKYRAAPARTDETFTFLTLSKLSTKKGILDLIEAISLLRARLEPRDWERVRFHIGGDGPANENKKLRGAADERGLARSITWLGLLPVDRARAEYESCDCYVLASHHESFGIVLVEALASGRPVIATRCGGPETIVNDSNGLLVAIQDPEGLSKALETMLNRARRYDPQRLHAEFMDRYSRSAVVGALDSVYEEVLAREASAARRTPS